MKRYRNLTLSEEQIIVHKETEEPGTGAYEELTEEGVYVCRRCDSPLYLSSSKFISSCGWPSFDDEIKNAVKKIPDADGRRTEILCNACCGHLGHVFSGEGFTKKNIRHCVNSASMLFVPAFIDGHERAIFAGGCFWGVEYFLAQEQGVLKVTSGYVGGKVINPTYEEVSSGLTGHAEAVEVIFDKRTNFFNLAKVFFEIHDPGQTDGQGPDIGPQYRSEIFYLTKAQHDDAKKLIDLLSAKGKVATKLTPAGPFYAAEDYHQNYYQKKGGTPYCHQRKKRF